MTGADGSEEIAVLREHRALFERLAESDLPISEDARRALDCLEAAEGTDV